MFDPVMALWAFSLLLSPLLCYKPDCLGRQAVPNFHFPLCLPLCFVFASLLLTIVGSSSFLSFCSFAFSPLSFTPCFTLVSNYLLRVLCLSKPTVDSPKGRPFKRELIRLSILLNPNKVVSEVGDSGRQSRDGRSCVSWPRLFCLECDLAT